jgi:hypothetical protein
MYEQSPQSAKRFPDCYLLGDFQRAAQEFNALNGYGYERADE